MNWTLLIIGIVLVIMLGALSLLVCKIVKAFKDLEKKYPYLFDTKKKSKVNKK